MKDKADLACALIFVVGCVFWITVTVTWSASEAKKQRQDPIPAEVQTRALVMELLDEIETMRKECGE